MEHETSDKQRRALEADNKKLQSENDEYLKMM
jgi:hypothetical protein